MAQRRRVVAGSGVQGDGPSGSDAAAMDPGGPGPWDGVVATPESDRGPGTPPTSPLPPASSRSIPADLRLARLFHEEAARETFAHLVVAVILTAFLWDDIAPRTLLGWDAVLIATIGLRQLVHRTASSFRDDAAALARRTRIAVLLPTIGWGCLTLTVGAAVSGEVWSRHLLGLAGLVAAATATQTADRRGYHTFAALILVPAALGTLMQGGGGNSVFDLLVIAAYAALMALIHERAHSQLLTRMATGVRLEAATVASTREKEFLDGVLASIPDAMALVDPQDRIQRMNEEFRTTVVPPDRRDGSLVLGDVARSGLGAVLAGTVETARRQGLAERECRTSAEGETRWYMAAAGRASGHAEGWVFLQLRDITGMRSAQEAQRKAEADLADMVESAHDLIWRVDNRGRWTFLNAAAEELYGAPRDRLLGSSSFDRSTPERRDADREAFQRIFEGGSLVNHVTIHQRSDGERRWMSFSGSPLRDETDAVVGAHGIARDVTAEIKAREALEELARRNSLVRSLINASDDMIFYKDVDSRYRGCNDAFQELMGFDEDGLQGQSDHDLFPTPLADANRARDVEVMERRTPIRYEINYDAERPERVWETVETPYVSDEGEVLGVLGISREMTEWKQAQERIQRMAEEAERAAAMKSAFLANMSHEIRTPMNGVLGMSELLQDTSLDTEQRQYVDVIRSSAENLLRILNDILDFSKIEAGRLALDEIPFDLHREVGDAVRLLAIPASRRGNELMVDIAADVPRWVEGDPGRLRQILTNLVGNAVKFTEDGEVEVGVRLAAAPEDGEPARVRITVRDSGIGIAEDKLTLIFQEFSQADTSVSRRYGGTGLGLAISRRLVDLMGGEMQLESSEGRGSTFTFDILLSPCDPPPDQARAVDAGPVDLSGLRILVVDDNPTNRRILRGVLGEAGATVHPADGGEAALHRLEELDAAGTLPDLIVMDVQMPEMDGIEAIERIRTDRAHDSRRTVPILVLTSANRPEDARRVRELGVEGYFLKPLPRPDLLRAVASIHAGRGADAVRDAGSPGLGLGAQLRNQRVLVAEDNPVNRLVARAILEKSGYQVAVAENGLEAVAAVRDQDFQLILMDVQMPEMDGLEATRIIREMENREERKRLPVIALTAHALDEERRRCLGAGMDDFLSKPFKGEELLALLERWTRTDKDPSTDGGAQRNGASAVDPEDRGAPVDLDGFRSMLRAAGIEHVLDATLSVFVADLPRRREALRAAGERADAVRIAEVAHALKSAAGNVYAYRLHTLVEDLETAGREEDRARLDRLLPDALAEIDRVHTFLETR